MTFPLLLAAGMSEIEANASNFVAVLPANVVGTHVYRKELAKVRKHLGLRLFLAAAGGVLGSWILITTGQESFQQVIPWLLLFATLSFGLGPWIKAKLERDFAFDGSRWMWLSFASGVHRLCLWRLFRPWHGHHLLSPSIRSSHR
jgi:uncharacterized protein